MLDIKSLTGSWNFNLRPSINPPPYGRSPVITVGSFDVDIRYTTPGLNLHCWEDVVTLKEQLFNPLAPARLRCPLFYRSGITAPYYQDAHFQLSFQSQYDPAINGIRLYRAVKNLATNLEELYPTHTTFRRCWFVGSNAPFGGGLSPVNPAQPVEWEVWMRPVRSDSRYYSKSVFEIEPIDMVLTTPFAPLIPV